MEEKENPLEERIEEWRSHLRRHPTVHDADIDELEDHLRSQIGALEESGLADDEAFLVAVKRMGALDSLSSEFAREYSERLWKQLVVTSDGADRWSNRILDGAVAIGLAIVAAILVKLPVAFGFGFDDGPEVGPFYLRNLSLFVLPLLAGYFAWKRGVEGASRWWVAVPFIIGVITVNIMPWKPQSHTEILAGLHLPIALWLTVGFAYTGTRWRDHDSRMDFIRFSGEWFIYYVLIAAGGGVLMGITMFIFQTIGLDAEEAVGEWIMPCGAMGAVLISAWLVEAKQSVVENMAPVLTRIFTPLFAVLLAIFLLAAVLNGGAINIEREALIGFDLLLVLVLGLLLYAISARDPQAPPGLFDALQLVLVISALLVDALALWAIAARISEFGFSPNKVAALGENIVLLVNLGWSAVLYARFLSRKESFAPLVRWQTGYLPVYAVWAWVVVVIFPLVFGFV